MTQCLFNRRSIGFSGILAVLVASLVASPALAKPKRVTQSSVDTSMCSSPQLSHPFLSSNDTNWYTLAPGETADNFDGGGWTLSGGAQIITTQLADGQTGSVLDLPSGSKAVSPSICVASDYPTARTMLQNGPGANIAFAVSYAGTPSWDKPAPAGGIKGSGTNWSISSPFQVHPGNLPGWQLVRFTLASNGKGSDAKIYNFYIDPRMKA
jgi:hypothetical protein